MPGMTSVCVQWVGAISCAIFHHLAEGEIIKQLYKFRVYAVVGAARSDAPFGPCQIREIKISCYYDLAVTGYAC